jgi:Zn-dependent peptidase ImmA (M78 family)
MITKARRHTIEEIATQVLQKSKAYRAPVPVDLVVGYLDLATQAKGLADASGILVVENDRGVIGFNAFHAPVRQRFTIAHEIGHFVLHVKAKQSRLFIDRSVAFHRDDESATGNDDEEIEANVFAAALLMPERLVREEIKRLALDLDDEGDLGTLAKRFNVSSAAMTYRLVNIGLLR